MATEQVRGGSDDGCYLDHKRIVRFDLRAELENQRQVVQKAVYEAFEAIARGNLSPAAQSLELQIEFPEEVLFESC